MFMKLCILFLNHENTYSPNEIERLRPRANARCKEREIERERERERERTRECKNATTFSSMKFDIFKVSISVAMSILL